MLNQNTTGRRRGKASEGEYTKLHGEYRGAYTSGALTTVAAATTTAGFVFTMRNPTGSAKVMALRYLAVDFNLTTAFGAAQAMGFDVIRASAYTASATGGTALDMGSTLTNTGKVRTNQVSSLFTANTCRIGGAGALTAGTQTLDASPVAACQKWMAGVGTQLSAVLIDARDDGGSTVRSPYEFAGDEGFVIRNTILMGATGVGSLIVTCEWDEVIV
jgi:hypothetical protein